LGGRSRKWTQKKLAESPPESKEKDIHHVWKTIVGGKRWEEKTRNRKGQKELNIAGPRETAKKGPQ